jgi:hypothetical protein
MSAELMFSLSNGLALLGWLILAFAPRRLSAFPIPTRFVIPTILGVAYALTIIPGMASAQGDFTSLEGLKSLYATAGDPLLVAGWQHYLAFDLFVGTWIAERLDGLGVHRIIQIPILAATFMLGPVGLVLAFALEAGIRIWRRRAVA